MNGSFWASLFALRDAADRAAIGAAKDLSEVRRSGQAETPKSAVVLSHLHLELKHQLDGWASSTLLPVTTPFRGDSDASRCLKLIAFWLNERVCLELEPADRGDFVPVGPRDVELQAGGELFFDEVESLLLAWHFGVSEARDAALGMSAEIALFALEQGFTGVRAGDIAQLDALKARLRRGALPAVIEPLEDVDGALVSERRRAFAAVFVGLVLAFYGCLAWLSQGLGDL
jgi:hypothetical protein